MAMLLLSCVYARQTYPLHVRYCNESLALHMTLPPLLWLDMIASLVSSICNWTHGRPHVRHYPQTSLYTLNDVTS